MTDMKQIFRIFTLIAVAMLTAGQAWADGTIAIGTTEGGSLACYSDAACTSTTKITSAEPGSTVYVRAVADGIHTLVGMTASNISVEETSGSGVAEARSVTRAPGIGLAVAVSAVEGKLGLYSFTMPSDGWNVCVKATFPDKAKTTAALAYQDWNGTALASAEKTAGQVYILDGTESILGTPGTSATNMTDVWYVCQTSATANSGAGLAYGDRYADNAVLTCADYCRVHLILKDVSKMTVESTHRGIYDNNEHGAALSIYAQSDGTDMGVLTVSGTAAIETTSSLTINGGKVTATGTNGQGLCVNYGDIAIHGGEVTSIGSGASIYAYIGNITITGGKINAEQGFNCGSEANYTAGGIMTIGWTNADDYIYANYYYCDVKMTAAKCFVVCDTDDDTDVSVIVPTGDVPKDNTSEYTPFYGKKLRPLDGNYVATTNSVVRFSDNYNRTFDLIVDDDPTDAFPGTTTHYYIYKAGDAVTLNSGEDGVLLDVSGLPDGTAYNASTNTFTMPSTDVTLTMRRYMTSVPYIGWDATEKQPIDDATTAEGMKVYILEGDEATLGTANAETWFIVRNTNTDATLNGGIDLAYSTPIEICSDVHLILADGVEMDVTTESLSHSGIYYTDVDHDNLSIYGQSAQSGTLRVAGKHGGIEVAGINVYGGIVNGVFVKGSKPGDPAAGSGIVTVRKLNIYGGTVNGTIVCNDDFTIYGGELCAVTTEQDYGINNPGSIFFKGGKLTASGLTAGINAGDIILDWSDPADFLYVNNYALSGEVHVIEGKRFVANTVGGTAPNEVLTPVGIIAGNPDYYNTVSVDAINGKKLLPLDGYCVTTASDGISIGTLSGTTFIAATPDFTIGTTPYYIYKASTEQNPVTVTFSYDGEGFAKLGGLPEGTTLNPVEGKPMQRSFDMPAQDVTLTTTAVTGFSVSGYYTYSGSAQTPSIKYGDNLSMNADDDFIVTGITKGGTNVTDAIDAGDYSLTIAGVGSYMGTASGIAFSINKKPVYNNSSTLIVGDAIYNGGKVIPEIELKDDNNNVIASSEYTVNIVSYDVFNHVIDYGNGNSLSSVMDVGIYYAVLYGKEESNYDIGVSSAFTVRQKPVGISWSTDALVYDGTAKAPTASATGVEDVDAGKVSVTVSIDGEHSDAGNYTATASALSGNRASNYRLPTSSDEGYVTLTNAFTISPKPVTVSGTGVTADNKTYDGTTDATVSGTFAFVDGMIIDGDDVSITGATGTFADKNVGTGKTVTISGFTLEGDDAGNYVLDTENQTPITATADIAAKTVTVTSGITASNKTYDGTTWATLSGSSAVISGKVTGDVLGVYASGSFSNKNVGTGKTVTFSSITLDGTDKGNYVLATTGNQATTTANITKKSLTVTADDKSVEYGDAAPTYTASYSGFVSGESKSNLSGSLSFSCSYTSSSKTGTYTITPSGHTSSNYSISYAAGTLTVGAKDVDYSGGTITQDENGYTVTLDEGTGSANTLPDDANLYSLTYSRTLTPPGSGEGEVTIGGQAANLYTVCLPFSPETGTGVKYYTLSGVSGETVSFEEVTTPAANTPYLIAVTGSTNIIESCTGKVVTSMEINSTTKDGYTFTGTFTGLKHAQAVGKHILQSHNKWRVVEASGSVFIPPFRAYIESVNGARMLTGCLDDEATGIDSLRLQDADGTEQWYDLNGRRISKPTRKGVYIHNGKVTTKR